MGDREGERSEKRAGTVRDDGKRAGKFEGDGNRAGNCERRW